MNQESDWMATFPEPIISVAIEAKTENDTKRLGVAIARLKKDHKNLFRVRHDLETGHTILSGWGEIGLQFVINSLDGKLASRLNVGRPWVHYRETIRRAAIEQGKFIRETSGLGQYGHCFLRLEPAPRGSGIEFVHEEGGSRIPEEFVQAVEKGAREGLKCGPLMGFPVTDVKVILTEAPIDETRSTEKAYQISGELAAKAACKQANPTILEPVMDFHITIGETFVGDVIGDLNGRRARIRDIGDVPKTETQKRLGDILPPYSEKIISCDVPLSELIGYSPPVRPGTLLSFGYSPSYWQEVSVARVRAITDPHGTDEPPAASAGRPVLPTRPRPGIPGQERKPFPPEEH